MRIAEQAILDYLAAHPGSGREAIRKGVAPQVSEASVWRALKRLTEAGKLSVTDKARATGYTVAGSALVRAYLQTPYNRRPAKTYNRAFLDRYVPGKTFYLTWLNHVFHNGNFIGVVVAYCILARFHPPALIKVVEIEGVAVALGYLAHEYPCCPPVALPERVGFIQGIMQLCHAALIAAQVVDVLIKRCQAFWQLFI